jgi:hypothetical protein
MKRQDNLRWVHIASTIWFVLAVGYLLVLTLRQAGVRWWVVFSLSGHGLLITLFLISLYLFAIFRGISSSQTVQVEHPLTRTTYYAMLYVLTPFLGGMAGCLGMIGARTSGQFRLGVAMGTLGVTFLVWVILDPAIGLLEMLLPASRKHRIQRLAETRAEKELKQKEREHVLAQILTNEDSDRRRWRELLKPQAEKLASLLAADGTDLKQAQREAVGIGVSAWQTGGLSCMREVRDMVITICEQKSRDKTAVDYISFWWDGIGNWRAAPLSSRR